MERIAVIQVRGTINSAGEVRDTLRSLNLQSQNYCTVVPKNDAYMGMIANAKDYITWGEIDDATYAALVEKRGQEHKGRLQDSRKKISYSHLEEGGKILKKFFRLNPPKKGYGRKGVKKPFKSGGALGYRGAKINDLIARML